IFDIYTLSLHDARPISENHVLGARFYKEAYIQNLYAGVSMRNYMVNDTFRYDLVLEPGVDPSTIAFQVLGANSVKLDGPDLVIRSEEHTSELQSRENLV